MKVYCIDGPLKDRSFPATGGLFYVQPIIDADHTIRYWLYEYETMYANAEVNYLKFAGTYDHPVIA